MVGVIDFGTYIPYFRIARAAIGEAWRIEQAKALLIGERSVAGYDEDTVTMAVEASLHALAGRDASQIDALYVATTTPPFGEKSSAAVVAAACDLSPSRTFDVSGSLRAGTAAMSLAFDALRAGSARQALVTAADMRRAEPGTLLEAISGDGAAALLLGNLDGVIAELVGEYHLSDPTVDTWRRSDDRYLQSDDEAFTNRVGYFDNVNAAINGLLETAQINPAEITSVAMYAPDGRAYLALAQKSKLFAAFKRMGMDAPALHLLLGAGNLGAAFALAQFALLLETASPGNLIALIGYGDGADAYLFRVTDALARRPQRRATQAWLDNKAALPYPLALSFREHLKDKELFPAQAAPWTSLPLLHREQNELLRFRAQKCGNCGAVWFPHRPNCYECGAQGNFQSIRLSRRGTVASFVAEWAIPGPLLPVGMVTVDTPEGARITTPLTDGDPRTLQVGDEVEFALRIFHTAKKLPHYSWKVRRKRD